MLGIGACGGFIVDILLQTGFTILTLKWKPAKLYPLNNLKSDITHINCYLALLLRRTDTA